MSHFTVLVIGENPEEQLKPFYEGLEMERYVLHTKEELIAKGKKEIEDYKNGHYAEYLSNPELYKSHCDGNQGHIDYLEKEFPKKLNYTDEEVYKEEIEDYEPEDIGEDGEVYSTSNPNGKWDWYLLGGRWKGSLKLKLAATGISGEEGIFPVESKDGYCDQAKKKDIDFEYMRNEAGLKATQVYEFAMTIISHLPENKTWEQCMKEIPIRDEAREFYWNQPRCLAWKQKSEEMKNDFPLGFSDSPDDFLISKQQYIENERNMAGVTFAVIKDGKWYERGEMGWFGCASDEKPQEQWNEEFKRLIDSLSDETLLSIYDCHV